MRSRSQRVQTRRGQLPRRRSTVRLCWGCCEMQTEHPTRHCPEGDVSAQQSIRNTKQHKMQTTHTISNSSFKQAASEAVIDWEYEIDIYSGTRQRRTIQRCSMLDVSYIRTIATARRHLEVDEANGFCNFLNRRPIIPTQLGRPPFALIRSISVPPAF